MGIYDEIRFERLTAHRELLSRARLVFADTNLPAACLAELCREAVQSGFRLAVDCVSVEKAKKLPADLRGVDLLLCNLDEVREVLGDQLDPRSEPDLTAAAAGKRGLARVIVTLGPQGVFFCDEGRAGHRAAPLVPRVVDVTGAGDSFIAGLLAGLCRGLALQEAVEAGQRVAALTLQSALTVSPQVGPHCLDPEGTRP
jgi:pseudouridine kinase